MENLTKHQIILLTLLVSFVTSIATGIVTVALMSQAPVGVTQTINRVVERTIEKVVTPTTKDSEIIKETVVVSSDNQIVEAVDKNIKSVIRIYRTNAEPDSGSESMILVGVGVFITDDGIIATDNNVISSSGKYFTLGKDDNLYGLDVLRSVNDEQIALLKIREDGKENIPFSKATLSNQGDIKLGQTVIYIGGESKNTVATGIVSVISTKDIKTETGTSSTQATSSMSTKTETIVTSIQTSMTTNNFISGGLLLNLSGELVGIKAIYSNSARADLFVPIDVVKTILSDFTESQKKSE